MCKEIVAYSNYHRSARRESKIIPGLEVEEDGAGVMYCPRCRTGQTGIDHGKTTQCACGLNMKRFGNALFIWEGKE
jgi:ferredoxin-thioredoxin reductase catalytic subunit